MARCLAKLGQSGLNRPHTSVYVLVHVCGAVSKLPNPEIQDTCTGRITFGSMIGENAAQQQLEELAVSKREMG